MYIYTYVYICIYIYMNYLEENYIYMHKCIYIVFLEVYIPFSFKNDKQSKLCDTTNA